MTENEQLDQAPSKSQEGPVKEQSADPPTSNPVPPGSANGNARARWQTLTRRTAFPYIVTLLLAILAWTVTHTVDRLIALPLLKFSLTQADGNLLSFEFENIASNVNFKNLTIMIRGENPETRFSEPVPTIVGRGWLDDVSLNPTGDAILLTMKNFHPGWELRLSTIMTGSGKPQVQLKSADVPTILEPISWRTILVELELLILACFAFVALFAIVWWAWRQNKVR